MEERVHMINAMERVERAAQAARAATPHGRTEAYRRLVRARIALNILVSRYGVASGLLRK